MASKNEMNQMMKQVQKMQADMMATQEKLAAETVEASVGGGVVKAVVTGSGTLESISIDPGAVDPDDVEMLQDLIVAAVNEGLRMAQELQAQSFGGITNALGGLGGGLGGPLAPGGSRGGTIMPRRSCGDSVIVELSEPNGLPGRF